MDEIEMVFQDATQLFGITREELCGRSQRQEVAEARHAVAWALRQRAMTFARIGRLLGGRGYTTILNSCTRAEELARHDPSYALKLAGLAAPQQRR